MKKIFLMVREEAVYLDWTLQDRWLARHFFFTTISSEMEWYKEEWGWSEATEMK